MPRKEKPSACAETSTGDGVRNSALLFSFLSHPVPLHILFYCRYRVVFPIPFFFFLCVCDPCTTRYT